MYHAIGQAIGAFGNVASSIINANSQKKFQKQQIAAQQAANRYNVQSQERINNQNIEFQERINNIMRKDESTAIQRKKRDLQAAGYSTADPNITGHSSAALSAPGLAAPQVQPEFSPEMSAQVLSANQGVANSIIDSAKFLTDAALTKAKTKEANENAKGMEIANAWSDAEHQLNYSQTLEVIENLKKDGKIKDKEAEKLTMDISQINSNIDLLREQIIGLREENKIKPKRLSKELIKLDEEINHIKSVIANTKADTDLKKIDKDIKGFEKRIRSVEANFAEMGINFNGNSIIDALSRVALSPRGSEVFPKTIEFIGSTFRGILSSLFEHVSEGAEIGKGILKSAVKGYANLFKYQSPGAFIIDYLKNQKN